MLQSWNKFCFTSGYIEVSMTLPGPNQETTGYVSSGQFVCLFLFRCSFSLPVAWGMDDGKPGETWVWSINGWYMALHVRPSSCSSVDSLIVLIPILAVTTHAMSVRFRIRHSETALAPPQCSAQTRRMRTTTSSCQCYQASVFRESISSSSPLPLPASNVCVLLSSNSACTCPGQDHPGPSTSKGRGAPEIDLIEAQHNKLGSGQVASQSAQFAPMTHDYLYGNSTPDQWTIYNLTITRPNPYK
jgi:hypothetical protein